VIVYTSVADLGGAGGPEGGGGTGAVLEGAGGARWSRNHANISDEKASATDSDGPPGLVITLSGHVMLTAQLLGLLEHNKRQMITQKLQMSH